MPKSSLRAAAEVAIFQCVVYDSKSRKRAIAVHACGDDVTWADDVPSLLDPDKRRTAPDWLKTQLRDLPEGSVRFNWKGERTTVSNGRVELLVPRGPAGENVQVPVDRTPVDTTACGEDLDEASILQG